MIGLDTNILLRYLMCDDPLQTPIVMALVGTLSAERTGYVSLVALAEVAWTLTHGRRMNKHALLDNLNRLMAMHHVRFQSHEAVADALACFACGSIDFPDHLIERTGHLDGCEVTMTFDRKASKTVGFRLLDATSVQVLGTCGRVV
ncbi:PIN domain-containing protein [Pararobbsia silviterrae]|uniref:PIN domain-containing protein n=1 Tax=Pararobbsia silviterrae TaxID=1792498 RepID=A0A494Y9G3_9BURK|nr:PIN domain-containing protein [Pararobbsia silviterrae]